MDFGAPLSANTQFDNLDDEAGLNRHHGIEELLESRTYRHQEATLEACLPLLSRLMIRD